MARIRTVKPEFWEDEAIGLLSRDARLLFIATFNLADDEGILRWTPAFIKAQVFMYDDDIGMAEVESLMGELGASGIVFAYSGGRAQQRLAYIVKFRKHQKINRPQPSKLPPPSPQNPQVRAMYARRDDWVCHLCGEEINNPPKDPDHRNLSVDHLVPRSEGGTDYPSNLAASHQTCNKRRGVSPIDSLSQSVNESVNATPKVAPGRGRGREGDQEGKGRDARGATPPPRTCQEHEGHANPPACVPCKNARLARETWEQDQAEQAKQARAAASRCRKCDGDGYVYEPGRKIPMTPYVKCSHEQGEAHA